METNNKLREALEKIANYDYAFVEGSYRAEGQICADIARKALAEPPRNCDVGTAKEQFERWRPFCDKYDKDCTGCPCDGPVLSMAYCFSNWAQMPYEKGEPDGSK